MRFFFLSSVSDMQVSEKKSIVIIGGGITGLTIAWKLCKNGENVTLLERQKFVGGFARGITHNGYSVDIGPHYFSISENSVIEEIIEIWKKIEQE